MNTIQAFMLYCVIGWLLLIDSSNARLNQPFLQPQVEITSGIINVKEDPDSMLWIANEKRIYRFDGSQTRELIFEPLVDEKYQITSLDLLPDYQMVISTYQHGIYLFDLKTGAWQRAANQDDTKNVVQMSYWKESLVVFLSEGSLFLLDTASKTVSPLYFLSEQPVSLNRFSISESGELFGLNSDSVWKFNVKFNRLSEIELDYQFSSIKDVAFYQEQMLILDGEQLVWASENKQWQTSVFKVEQLSKLLSFNKQRIMVSDNTSKVQQYEIQENYLVPVKSTYSLFSHVVDLVDFGSGNQWFILEKSPYLMRVSDHPYQQEQFLNRLRDSVPKLTNAQFASKSPLNVFTQLNAKPVFDIKENESLWLQWSLGAWVLAGDYRIQWKLEHEDTWNNADNKQMILVPSELIIRDDERVKIKVRAFFPSIGIKTNESEVFIAVQEAASEANALMSVLWTLLAAIILAFLFWVFMRRYQKEIAIKAANQKMELALQSSGDEVWDWDIESNLLTRLNPNSRWQLEWNNVASSVNIYGNMHEADMKQFKAMLQKTLKGQQELFDLSFRLLGVDEQWVWVRAKGKVIERGIDGKAKRFTGVIHDVDQFKRTKQKLKIIATSFENTFNGAWIADKNRQIINVNKAYCKIKGVTESDVLGKPVTFPEIHGQDENLESMMWDVLDQLGHWQAEMWDVRANGEEFPIEITIDSVVDESEGLSHYVAVFSDITFKRKSEQELRRLANYDALTELPNRSFLEAVVEQSIYHCRRKKDKICLMQLDLDDFKDVNDSLGHSVGDELLKMIARRLDTLIEDPDIIARIGGDEFAILMHNVESPSLMADKAQQCIEVIEQPIQLQDQELNVRCSIGVVIYPEDGDDFETLVRNADTAMHHQKRSGKAGYKFYSEEMNQSLLQKLALESNLRKAIQADEFVIQYQPKMCADHSNLNGMEALVRWIRPDGQFVSPGLFIPFAEDSGQIVELGDLILRKACEETKSLFNAGKIDGRLAVNLSGKQFTQDDIVDRVISIIEETGFNPNHLELEITEGAVMNETERAIEKMKEFNKLGIQLSIDDFGTGYSSLSYLKRFPVSTLKIDRSFIIEIHQTAEDKNIVYSVIGLAHSLGLKVVAEGVEEIEQASVLKDLGCDVIQGYLYSRPLVLNDLQQYLGDWRHHLPKLQHLEIASVN